MIRAKANQGSKGLIYPHFAGQGDGRKKARIERA
jgi:hypothetical protein